MKTSFTKIIALMAILAITTSCSKDDDIGKDVQIDDKNLTNCPENSSCQYLFFENSDLNTEPTTVKSGQFRLFLSKIHTSMDERMLYIKAPIEGDSFSLDKKDILAGKAVYTFICPACDFVGMKPVDGFAKGLKIAPTGVNTESKWLLEYNIILQAASNAAYRDTIYVKQYFEAGITIGY